MKLNKAAYLLAFLPLLAATAHAQDCTPAHEFKTVHAGQLTVAAYELPPFDFVRPDGTLGGVEGEIIDRVAKLECLKVNLLLVDPGAVIQYITSGRADIGAGNWYRTVARTKVVALSAPTYLDKMAYFSKEGYTDLDTFKDKKVGVVQGSLWVSDLKAVLGDNMVLYPNAVAMAQDLTAGRINVGVESYAGGIEAQKKGGYAGMQVKLAGADERVASSLEPGQANFPHTKENEGLSTALANNIAKIRESGDLAKILQDHGLDPSVAEVGDPRMIK